jgi:AAA domain
MSPSNVDPDHCILTKEYRVFTPPIYEMTAKIGDWVDQQRPGGFIYGASRLGKSSAIRYYLEDTLAERFKSTIPLVIWNRLPDSQPTQASFWHHLLMASRFQFVNPEKPATSTKGAYLCLQRFISIAKSAGRNYVVLLIDEAQEMTLKEWKWLVGLQNQLDYERIFLSVFSVGTRQLGYKHDYLASTGNAHVAARFMTAHARFHGIRSVEELAYVLNGYDVDSEWPEGTGASYLKAFAPTSFAAGRRLSDHAGFFWRALLELRPPPARNVTEFPMEHIARTVEDLLKQLADGKDWDEVTEYNSWLKGLAANNFSGHMRAIATAG